MDFIFIYIVYKMRARWQKKVNAINNKFDMRPQEEEKSLIRSVVRYMKNMKYSLVHQRLHCSILMCECMCATARSSMLDVPTLCHVRAREREWQPVPNMNVEKKNVQIQNCTWIRNEQAAILYFVNEYDVIAVMTIYK